MNFPLITTKLLVPKPRQELITRPVLLDCLSEGLTKKLVLISASSGYGKTTLMAEWCAERRREYPLAWVSLDEGDNDPIRFLSYMIAALQNVQEGLGQDSAAILHGVQGPIETSILPLLINELSAVSYEFTLVLEDYHVIQVREIHQIMVFLLDHMPPQMHLVILTRADPPFPLARMRARGEMLEIRVKDLRFAHVDATTFLRDMAGLPLSDDEVQILLERTEGWITGLQLAALSMQGRENLSDLVATFGSGRGYIVDYLIEEVIERQPEELKTFLLKTSILGRMNGSLCNALTGQENGDVTLEYLDKTNLFISPLGDDLHWHRYHRLFADVLQNRLHREHPNQLFELHQRAAKWLAKNNLITEAIEHAFAANDLLYAANLVENSAMELLRKGAIYTLLGWLKKFPGEIFDRTPWLCVFQAWCFLLTGNLEHLEHYLTLAEKGQLDEPARLRGNVAAIRAYAFAMQGNIGEALQQAGDSLRWLSEDDYTVRSTVTFVMGGILFLQKDIPKAIQTFKEASFAGERAGNLHVAIPALCSWGDLLLEQGETIQAEEVYQRAMALGSGKSGRPLPITASAYSGLADICLMRDKLDDATHFAQLGVDLAEKWGQGESLASGLVTLAKVNLAKGNASDAQQAIQKAERIVDTHSMAPGLREKIEVWKTKILAKPVDAAVHSGLIDPLSERELEVLQLFAEGLSNQEIADQLIISLGTVKAHSSNIYRKLDVRNRTQAVVAAQEMKLL